MLENRYFWFNVLEVELPFLHMWPCPCLTMTYNFILTMPIPSWAMGWINCMGRKQFNFSDKITYIQKLLHLKTTTTTTKEILSPTSKGPIKLFGRGCASRPLQSAWTFLVFSRIWSVIKCPAAKESKRHCRLFKAKSSRCFYEINYLLGHILQSRGTF